MYNYFRLNLQIFEGSEKHVRHTLLEEYLEEIFYEVLPQLKYIKPRYFSIEKWNNMKNIIGKELMNREGELLNLKLKYIVSLCINFILTVSTTSLILKNIFKII